MFRATRAAAGLLLIAARTAFAVPPEIGFERLETATGPSHNSIFAITQDREGFLWVGTQDGLNRFDGERFLVHRNDPREPGSLSANRVDAVLEDSRDRLWIGTAVGIDRLDRSSGRFERTALGAGRAAVSVFEIVEGPEGTLWAGTGAGLLRWDEEGGRWSPALPQAVPVRRVRVTAAGELWLLAGGELWRVSEGRVRERRALPAGRGGLELGPDGSPLLDAGRDGEEGGGGPIQALLLERSGELWVATHDGLLRRPPGGGPVERLAVDRTRPLANFVATLYRDAGGILWLGTENGLYRHDPQAGRFRSLAMTAGERGSALHVSALVEDAAGALWIGTFGAGLFRQARSAGPASGASSAIEPVAGLPGGAIWSLARVGDELLVGGDGWLCSVVADGATVRCPRPVEGLRRAGVLVTDEIGDLWVADLDTLRRRDSRDGRWTAHPLPADPGTFGADEIVDLRVDGETVWVACFGGPLWAFDRASGRFSAIRRLDSAGWEQTSPVFDLLADGSGGLWLGTGDGLSRMDPATGRFRHYAQGDGLPGSNVYALLEDDRGRLWLGTNRGLVRFDPAAPGERRFRVYDARDGVVNVEFNRHARLRAADGRFLFGGMSGITLFRPEEIRDNPVPPPVALTRVTILGRGGERTLEPHRLERIELEPGDSTLALEFAALGFSDATRSRFGYRLEGVDPGWVDAGSGRVARYAGLAPGSYRFLLRAANADGVWTDDPLSIAVVARPPFWATPGFRIAAVAALAGLLGLLYRWRVRHLIELERMRLRIAGDLHDELGSDLSGIALASSRLGARESLEPADRRRLVEIQEASLRVMRGLRDIVWYVDPEHDNLEATARRMRAVARDLLPDCELRFAEDLQVDAHGIDMAIRRQVFLVFKELIHNAARHARARSVGIELAARGAELRLSIADDGVGFDPDGVTDGSGLASIRRRARQSGGRLDIESRPGAGTRALLVVPMTRTRQSLGRRRPPRLEAGGDRR